MVVPITDIVKMALSVADISAEPIISTPLVCTRAYVCVFVYAHVQYTHRLRVLITW